MLAFIKMRCLAFEATEDDKILWEMISPRERVPVQGRRRKGQRMESVQPCQQEAWERRRSPPFFPVLKVSSFIKAAWFHWCELHFKMLIFKAFSMCDVFQIEILKFVATGDSEAK